MVVAGRSIKDSDESFPKFPENMLGSFEAEVLVEVPIQVDSLS